MFDSVSVQDLLVAGGAVLAWGLGIIAGLLS